MKAVVDAPIYGAILVTYLAAMFVIGLLAQRVSKTPDDFWVSGRRLGIGVLTGTFGATFISSVTMIGMAGNAYRSGWSQWMIGNGTWIGPLIMLLTIHYFVRFMGYTVADIFEARYGVATRPVAAVITVVGGFAFMGVQMYAMGTVLSLIFGWPLMNAILLTSLVFIAYAAAGGFFAVAWTDCVQAVMLMVGIVVVAFLALSKVGGFSALNTQLATVSPGHLDPWGPLKDPLTIMAMALAFGIGNPSQPWYLTRAFAARNSTSIRVALANGALMNVWAMFFGTVIGLSGRVLYGGQITPVDAIFPFVTTQLVPPIIGGLIIAAIVAAIMSTADSLLVAVGTSVARDFYQRFMRPDASHGQLLAVTRWTMAIVGLLGIAVALWAPSTVMTMGAYVFGSIGAAFFVPLYVGFFWRRGTATGAIAAMVLGVTGVVFFTRVPVGIHPIIMGAGISLVAYLVGSWITPAQYALADSFMVRIGRKPAPPAADPLPRTG